MPSKCTPSEKKAAGLHLASALGHGMQKYAKTIKRRSSFLAGDEEHKAFLPKSVISHFEKIRAALKAKYEKVKEAKSKKAATKVGGAPKKYTSTTEVRKDIAEAEKHIKTMVAVKESAEAAKKEIVAVMQKHGSRYECLPTAEFSFIKKTNTFYTRISKSAEAMVAKDTKKVAALQKKLGKMVDARNKLAMKKKTTKKN